MSVIAINYGQPTENVVGVAYRCTRCQAITVLPAAGGTLKDCGCDDREVDIAWLRAEEWVPFGYSDEVPQ